MQFTSVLFLFFLAVVFALYWALPPRFRWGAALAASAVFYLPFGAGAFVLLFACCLLCWGGGLFLARRPHRRGPLFFCLFWCLLPLFLFKYTSIPARFALIAPVGISFYTFKMISYLVEVSRGKIPARRHLGHVALYLTFFTEVASGPIQRPGDLLPQIEAPRTFQYQRALSGAQLILWGLFKKIVLADNIAYYVDYGFARPDVVMGASLILAALMYAIQIYCDFSGYSDIAIGCMGLLGYQVPENFKSPYFSLSVKEFWGRWHISLSQFLRDYVYIPLGGSRCSKGRQALNLMVTFLVSGIWHGAGATFLVWGALHGAYRVFGLFTARLRAGFWQVLHLSEEGLPARICKTLVTFLLICAAWVVFRAGSISQAVHLFARMPDSFSLSLQTFKNAAVMLTLNAAMVLRLGVFTAVLGAVDLCSKDSGFSFWLAARKPLFQTLFCYFLLFSILFYGISGTGSFIYFQF